MSNENEPKTFEEAFDRYIEYRTRFERLENEFDEYQQSSLNYEQELEVQLKQLDERVHCLQQDLFMERTQNEQYRERTEQTIKQSDKRFDKIEEELNTCKNLNEKLTNYIRELEQTNDDLERSKRTLFDSLSTFETKLNRALEQNALLENELDEKEQLTETVQRLRDETRDLREEVDRLHKTNKEKLINSNETPVVNSDRMKTILSEAAPPLSTTKTKRNDDEIEQDLLNDNKKHPPSSNDNNNDISKTRKLSTTDLLRMGSTSIDSSFFQGNDVYQPLSNSTRLQSLKLINDAFRRFSSIETTLSKQRKQSQLSSPTYFTRSRVNSVINPTYNRNTETILNQTQS